MTTKEILSNIIHDFNPESFKTFFRLKNTDFAPVSQPLNHYQDKEFTDFYQIGEINFREASQRLIVIAIKILIPLSERSGKKAQYEKAKKILRELNVFDAGIFVFYDQNNNFRFSLIYAESLGTRRQFSNFKRFTYFVSKDLTNNTFLSRTGDVDFLTLENIKEAFSLEPVNKEFFSTVAMLFTKLAGGERRIGREEFKGKGLLYLPSTVDDTLKKEFSIRLIGRLVFCWFLKKKHSEAGVSLLPDELLSSASVRKTPNYYHSILEPLFFETLNTPAEERKKIFQSDPWAKVPFLNGGLFTPDDHDFYRVNALDISMFVNVLKVPDTWIKDLFEVFEAYNFTIDENTSVDVEISIDPEMLGRIFENLLAEINPETGETARKATGSYYTPRPIVEYMVDESLKQYLLNKTKVSEDKISLLLSYSDEEITLNESDKDAILDALDTIKIIDPACGSGAFPIGILHKMLLILQRIDPDSQKWIDKKLSQIESVTVRKELGKKLRKENWNYVHKLGIIQSSIYGVDIQPIATEISRLRFFLSLIVDEKVNDGESNRGIDPLPNLEFKFICANSLIPLEKEGDELFDNKEMAQQMQDIRDRYFKTDSARIKDKMKRDFENVLKKSYSLFASKKQKQLLTYHPFDTNNICVFFDSRFMFGVDGFDIAIANPPYNAKLSKAERVFFKNLYKSVKSGRQDTAAIFVELAKVIGNDKMQFAYILPYRLFSRKRNHGQFQIYTLNNFSIQRIIYLGSEVGFSSKDEFMILFMTSNCKEDNQIRIAFKPILDSLRDEGIYKNLSQSSLIKQNEINLNLSKYDQHLLARIRNKTVPLNSICDVKDGIVPFIREKLVSTQKKDERYVRFAGIAGKYVLEKYYFYNNPLYLCYDINEAKKYIKDTSELRKVQLREKDIFLHRKIITAQNSAILKGAIDEHKTFVSNSLHSTYLKEESKNKYALEYILALINSNLLNYYHDSLRLKGIDLHPQILIKDLKSLPIKDVSLSEQKPFVNLVSKVLEITKNVDYLNNQPRQAKIKEYERQIDQMVYKLYDLTEKEIKIIEGFNE